MKAKTRAIGVVTGQNTDNIITRMATPISSPSSVLIKRYFRIRREEMMIVVKKPSVYITNHPLFTEHLLYLFCVWEGYGVILLRT